MTQLTNMEHAQALAHEAARSDLSKGLKPDATRHAARINSAWANWYDHSIIELTDDAAKKWVGAHILLNIGEAVTFAAKHDGDNEDLMNLLCGSCDFDDWAEEVDRNLVEDQRADLIAELDTDAAGFVAALAQAARDGDRVADDATDESQIDREDFRREPLEFWAVDDHAAHMLRERGETVEDLLGIKVWGRVTSGQMIMQDYVVRSIAATRLT